MPRSTGPDYSVVTRNLALELVRVTEAAALGSAQWMGLGDKRAADQAAVTACGHIYHLECWQQVVAFAGERGVSCPNCPG